MPKIDNIRYMKEYMTLDGFDELPSDPVQVIIPNAGSYSDSEDSSCDESDSELEFEFEDEIEWDFEDDPEAEYELCFDDSTPLSRQNSKRRRPLRPRN
jgi:hypothetical protein